MPAFDLILFDFDGTLADSEAVLVGLVNDALQAHGHLPVAHPAIAARIGLPLEKVFQGVRPDLGRAEIAAISAGYRERAHDPEIVRRFVLFPDVRDTLHALHARDVRLGIATSKSRQTTVDIVAHCGIAPVIDEIFGGDSVARGKPDPEMVETALRHFGCERQRTLLVGDTSFDLEMGRTAGVRTCAVSWGMQPLDTLRQCAPDFVIDHISNLHRIVFSH